MKRVFLFLLSATMIASLSQCTKDGGQGPQGQEGSQGEQGPKGADGKDGQDGKTGPKGDTGPRGATGPKGDKGDTGPRGATGPKGEKGDTGPRGATGPKGEKGDRGLQGYTGAKGSPGDDGNANVTQYIINKQIKPVKANSGFWWKLSIDPYIAKNAIFLVFVQRASTWYPVPGDQFQYMSHNTSGNTTTITIGKPTPSALSWSGKFSVKIFVIEASETVYFRNSDPLPDFKDYHAVCEYYGLEE